MTVRYASGCGAAGDLIEELIRPDTAPRRLTVVSSDHRLQRAARRRRARAADSDVWLRQLVADERQRATGEPAGLDKPEGPPSDTEVAGWLAVFTGPGTGARVSDGADTRRRTAADGRPRIAGGFGVPFFLSVVQNELVFPGPRSAEIFRGSPSEFQR
ncbi:MAG TPA: hypothetical protein EYH34_05055 [Planctomycetes bacterium]|nr:hypothetical protein [Planctomycetota bacterium]